jgi:hypothetical protein
MSYNSWLYTYGNPINYTDPTGLISEKNADEARNIVNDLKTYNVFIKVDWGYVRVSQYSSTSCSWNEGGWTMPDLKAIQAGVHIMDKGVRFLGGNFKPLSGTVQIVSQKAGWDHKGDESAGAPPRAEAVKGKIIWRVPNWQTESYRVYVTIHEMGHIIHLHNPEVLAYFLDELQAKCDIQRDDNYCNNGYPKDGGLYDTGKFAGTINDPTQYMPTDNASKGSYEDFADSWREVVTRAYIRSGDSTYIKQARPAYEYLSLHHDIGRRRKVMNSIINGSWK